MTSETATPGETGLDAAPAWQRPFRFVGAVLGKVFRDPVVHGRLRAIAWPPGLVAIVSLAVIGYLTALALAVTGPLLRRVMPLQIMPGQGSAPGSLLFAILALVCFAVALFQIGALHAAWWIRIAALLISAVTLSRLGGFGDQYGSATQLAVLAACLGGLVLLQIIRWRGRFVWWEAPPVLLIFAVAVLSASQPVEYYRDMASGAELSFSYLIISQLNYLAGPVAMASGFAIAQLAFATVVWTVDLGRRELPGWVIRIALAALLGWRIYAEGRSLIVRSELQAGMLIWPVALLVAGGTGWFVLDRIADRRRAGTTRISDLSEDLRHLVYPVALVILAPSVVIPLITEPLEYLAQVSDRAEWGFGGLLRVVTGALVPLQFRDTAWGAIAAALLLALALRNAWRGDRGRAELLLTITLVQVGTVFSSTVFSTRYLGAWMIIGVLLLTIMLLIRRRLTNRRVEGLLLLTAVATVATTRGVFADPFEVLLGGSAAVLLGLIWALLSGGDDANGDSPMLPRPARVCLLFANSLFGMAVLAFGKVSSQMPEVSGHLDLMNLSGDALLGGGLLLGAAVAVFGQVWRNDELNAGGDLAALQVYGR